MRIFMPSDADMVRAINPFKAKNLTFEGGGAAGLAYVGAVQALEQQQILNNIERVAGTSAGAITAYLIAIGCTSAEIKKYLSAQSLNDMVYKRWYNPFTWNLFREYGVYEKDKIVSWLENITAEKLGATNRRITFAQLKALRDDNLLKNNTNNQIKDLSICVTNLTTQHLDIFCGDSPRYKDTAIVDAVALGSVSIPFYFKAWKYLTHWFVDGGVIANDPQIIYDTPSDQTEHQDYEFNEETLAFRLDTQAEVASMVDGYDTGRSQKKSVTSSGFFSTKIDGMISYVQALVNALQQSQSLYFKHSYNRYRTVIIPRSVNLKGETQEIGATDFNMSEEAKTQLMSNGLKATLDHFEKAHRILVQDEVFEQVINPQTQAQLLTRSTAASMRNRGPSLDSMRAVNDMVVGDARPNSPNISYC
jgi:NTE family protein